MKKIKTKNLWIKVICGSFVGFINGLFGGGGGMLVVPVFKDFLKFDTKKAHASAIFVILPLCITSIATYLLTNNFNLNYALEITLGGIAGGILGALLLSKLQGKIINIIFIVFLIAAGIKLII